MNLRDHFDRSECRSDVRSGLRPAFRVVAAYENLHAGHLAKQALDLIGKHLPMRGEVKATFWRFDILGLAELRESIAADIDRADLLLVVANEAADWADDILKDLLPERSDSPPELLLVDLAEHSIRSVEDAGYLNRSHPAPDSSARRSLRSCC